jgi:hypothetical protein
MEVKVPAVVKLVHPGPACSLSVSEARQSMPSRNLEQGSEVREETFPSSKRRKVPRRTYHRYSGGSLGLRLAELKVS